VGIAERFVEGTNFLGRTGDGGRLGSRVGNNIAMIELKNRVIMVTGASSGIGRECAILCSRAGASVALVGRDVGRLEETRSRMSGPGHCVVRQELTDFEALGGMVGRVVEEMGPVSGLVHSAGSQMTRSLGRMTAAGYGEMFSIHAVAGFELARWICRGENRAAGRVSLVMVASMMGLVGRPGLTAYAASKGAVIAGVRAMAVELAGKGVTVNSVSPGMVMTPLMEGYLAGLTAEQAAERREQYPLGPGQPEDVAQACVFLLSDAARWITGTNLVVDGGCSAG
jgi:NAD(P)-dependent dehydrogenase (short-subunit alcohol dehydrogenase family)